MPPADPSADPVAVLDGDQATAVVSVLAEAFHDYPVMRFVLGDAGDYDARLDTLITFFVMARVLRDETMLGVSHHDRLVAAALVSRPTRPGPTPHPLARLRDETWTALGPGARTRYEAFSAAAGRFALQHDHLHLNMIGVRRAERRLGLGRRLLDAVHAMSAADPGSSGVSLSTELASNVPLYEHFGYRALGSAEVDSAFTTWAMFRPDEPGGRSAEKDSDSSA